MDDPLLKNKNLKTVVESNKLRIYVPRNKKGEKVPAKLVVKDNEQIYYVGVWHLCNDVFLKILSKKGGNKIHAVILLKRTDTNEVSILRKIKTSVTEFDRTLELLNYELPQTNEIDCRMCKTPEEVFEKMKEGNYL